MAITRVGVSYLGSQSLASTDRGGSVQMMPAGPYKEAYGTEAETVTRLYAKWRTGAGPDTPDRRDWISAFNIAVSVRTVPKGRTGTGSQTWGQWSPYYWRRVAAADCAPSTLGNDLMPDGSANEDGYQWAFDLAKVDWLGNKSDTEGASTVVGGAVAQVTQVEENSAGRGDAVWAFDSRRCDAAQFRVRVRAFYPDGWTDGDGDGQSDAVQASATLWYRPGYEVTSCYYAPGNKLAFGYRKVPESWTRPDNSWRLDSLGWTDDGDVERNDGGQTGSVTSDGHVFVPTYQLSYPPDVGAKVQVRLDVRPSYWGRDWDAFATAVNQPGAFNPTGLTVQDRSRCRRLLVNTRYSGNRLLVKAIPSPDASEASKVLPTSYTVKLVGGRWSFDEVSGDIRQELALRFPPIGTDYQIVVTGSARIDGFGTALSPQTKARPPRLEVFPVRDIIESVDGSAGISCFLDPSREYNHKRDVDLVKFNGRTRPSAFYGAATETTIKYTMTLMSSVPSGSKVFAQPETGVDYLASAGPCVLRTHDGRRKVVAVTQAGTTRNVDLYSSASITLAEVDYD